MNRSTFWFLACLLCFTGSLLVTGCGKSTGNNNNKNRGQKVDIAVCDPAGTFSNIITNPYLPYPVDGTSTFLGEADGATVELVVTVFSTPEVVAGVSTRVYQEYEKTNGKVAEASLNYIAQASDGAVCYFGEDVDIYDINGNITSHEGAWRAGGDNKPGILMPANPKVGMYWEQEYAPGLAEDNAKIVSMGDTVIVPLGTYHDTIYTKEWSNLDPTDKPKKWYAHGIGIIKDETLELTGHTP